MPIGIAQPSDMELIAVLVDNCKIKERLKYKQLLFFSKVIKMLTSNLLQMPCHYKICSTLKFVNCV
jgi:hypothetical protein